VSIRAATIAVLLTLASAAPGFAQQDAAQLLVRLQQLEEQVRNLTGQVEGLTFQLTQMQTILEKKSADDEFRFQQLEGGAPAAATPPPANALPQSEDRLPPTPSVAPGQPQPPDLEDDAAPMHDDMGDAGGPGVPGGFGDAGGLGDSRDPMLSNGGQDVPLGQLPGGELRTPGGQPLDLRLANVDPDEPALRDADAQYSAAYDGIVRGDYEFAEGQFRQFIDLYPSDERVPDATNWLGEALIGLEAYDEAAEVLLDGFQKFPASPRAPDMLLKLGIALYGADEPEAACRTYLEIDRRYADAPAAFQQRLAGEKARAQCPAG